MRHGNKKRTLHRDKRQYTALIRSLARSLILHGGIVTTVAKAKEVRPFVEKLITIAKEDTVANRRVVRTRSGCDTATKEIFSSLTPRYKARAGGYTRIIRLGRVGKRVGEQARIELLK